MSNSRRSIGPFMKDRTKSLNGDGGAFKRIPICNHCVNLNKWNKENGDNGVVGVVGKAEFPTDHWLRESPGPNSPIVCPQLLVTECRFCHKMGHTKSLCKDLKEKKARDSMLNREKHQEKHQEKRRSEFDLPEKTRKYVCAEEAECLADSESEPVIISGKPSYKSMLQAEPKARVHFPRSTSPLEPPPARIIENYLLTKDSSDFVPQVVVRRRPLHWSDYSSDDD
jgi:hypothetical protein